jgi:hypothetical protein
MYGNDAPFWGIDAERWSSCSLEGEEVWVNKGKKEKRGGGNCRLCVKV